MKKHSLFKVIAITIAVAVLLTWIFPITYFGYSYTEEARSQVGLFELFSMGQVLFTYFGNVIFYILTVGGFYGVLHQIDGYRNLLNKIVTKFKGKEWIFLTAVMILFAFITSMAGITTGLLFLFPFVISVIVLMGYNKLTAALTTVGAVAVGLIGTTVSAANTTVIMSILNIKFNAELITKIIILVIGLVLLIFNVLRYAKKHKDLNEESSDLVLPETKNEKKRTWPLIVIIDIILLVMIMASISWETAFGIKFFTEMNESIMNFKVLEFPIFAKLLGLDSTKALGSWTLAEFNMLLVLGAGLLGLIYRVKFNDFIKSFFGGVKKALKPAILVFLAYVVLVISATHPVLLAICKPLLTATNGFNPFTMSIAAFLNAIFNVEPYYIASASGTLQYAVSIIKDTTVYPAIAVVWQAMQGLATLIAPTSVVLIVTLSYLEVSFWQWIKASWKLILEILVALLLIFTILILI